MHWTNNYTEPFLIQAIQEPIFGSVWTEFPPWFWLKFPIRGSIDDMYKRFRSPLNQEQNPSFEFSWTIFKLDLHSMIDISNDDKHEPVEDSCVADTVSLPTGFAYNGFVV